MYTFSRTDCYSAKNDREKVEDKTERCIKGIEEETYFKKKNKSQESFLSQSARPKQNF